MSVSAVQFYARTEHFNLMDGTFKFKAQTKKKERNQLHSKSPQSLKCDLHLNGLPPAAKLNISDRRFLK